MEQVLFYGVPSGCSLASIIALEWLGQPYKLCRIEMLEHPWPATFARANPRMKTPALMLSPQVSLTESLAILQHIGSRGIDAGLGFRQGTLEFDRLAETLSYLTTDFFASFAPLWKLVETTGLPEDLRQRMRSEAVAQVNVELGHVERVLADRAWLLGGASPTVADAYLFAVGRWAAYHEVSDIASTYPAVFAHAERMKELPAVRFALGIEANEPVQGGSGFRGHVSLATLQESGVL
ncbi:glutathione S-transferase family protein [Massilia sp. LjRoot122]|uniref:glutathione S-transferase family protein n=1 Tax=Massilia sp. LjRoot122 TaxID=3342257 RepID=UPI003ECD9EF1